MSDRAEQRALEAYPVEADGVDMYPISRTGYIAGYHQAEKDLALTWEDMHTICNLTYEVLKENNYVSLQGKYTEVLKRFLESKKK